MATEHITKDEVISLFEKWSDGYAYIEIPVQDAIRQVSALPPADVRPVEEGLWLRVGNSGLASCRCGFITDRYSTYRYCPNCGRKNGGVEYGG